jgi:hypothetical protein
MMRMRRITVIACAVLIACAGLASAGRSHASTADQAAVSSTIAPAGMGWRCSGPLNVKIEGTDRYTVGPGRIECRVRRCHRSTLCTRRDPRWVIRRVFGRHGRQAERVAWCEGRFNTAAGGRGYYRGTFQMGRPERARWGHGAGLWKQSRAAKGYADWSATHGRHRRWQPWQCQP